jgi:hypothetical protein
MSGAEELVRNPVREALESADEPLSPGRLQQRIAKKQTGCDHRRHPGRVRVVLEADEIAEGSEGRKYRKQGSNATQANALVDLAWIAIHINPGDEPPII